MCYCYLLHGKTKTGKYTTYTGFTTDIKRRLKQHNGKLTGGAKYTKRCKNWKLICLVHGFTNEKEARQFEYAWKHKGSGSKLEKCVKMCSSEKYSHVSFILY